MNRINILFIKILFVMILLFMALGFKGVFAYDFVLTDGTEAMYRDDRIEAIADFKANILPDGEDCLGWYVGDTYFYILKSQLNNAGYTYDNIKFYVVDDFGGVHIRMVPLSKYNASFEVKQAKFKDDANGKAVLESYQLIGGTWYQYYKDTSHYIAKDAWAGYYDFYSEVDIYTDINCTDLFFQVTPPNIPDPVEEIILAPIMKTQEEKAGTILQEIILILPMILVVVVSFLGLRKVLQILSQLLHQA